MRFLERVHWQDPNVQVQDLLQTVQIMLEAIELHPCNWLYKLYLINFGPLIITLSYI